mmetsp:Transcript_90640/g.234003  ORF Transcript_90640/g.234003 Transcript_90640/m.234003 type:complete len:384 (+) Transcript_90640:152-1303(+)
MAVAQPSGELLLQSLTGMASKQEKGEQSQGSSDGSDATGTPLEAGSSDSDEERGPHGRTIKSRSSSSTRLALETCSSSPKLPTLKELDLKHLKLIWTEEADCDRGDESSAKAGRAGNACNLMCYSSGAIGIVVGIMMGPTGVSVAVGLIASATFTAGLNGTMFMKRKPDCNLVEYAKEMLVGSLQGIAASLGFTLIGLAPFSAPWILQYLHMWGLGSYVHGASLAVSDVADLAFAGGYLGSHVTKNIGDIRTSDQVLSVPNAIYYGITCFIGPLLSAFMVPPRMTRAQWEEYQAKRKDKAFQSSAVQKSSLFSYNASPNIHAAALAGMLVLPCATTAPMGAGQPSTDAVWPSMPHTYAYHLMILTRAFVSAITAELAEFGCQG